MYIAHNWIKINKEKLQNCVFSTERTEVSMYIICTLYIIGLKVCNKEKLQNCVVSTERTEVCNMYGQTVRANTNP